ncbi:hypothetical protein JCM11641_007772 [Rhodosporidiobolus odoratus]
MARTRRQDPTHHTTRGKWHARHRAKRAAATANSEADSTSGSDTFGDGDKDIEADDNDSADSGEARALSSSEEDIEDSMGGLPSQGQRQGAAASSAIDKQLVEGNSPSPQALAGQAVFV